ncbi:transposase [Pigmentibacter sp. JX0631]|uniref:IS66 family transposase n=1 Tax=Pigmentibacter sp. JX0631 TaxID=2976982 RepID=UPI00246937EC|nr:transposase [Pigmentibacter sp. JX0631]WGL61544.1 transposase [Pigmentibacter sp. JX0631]
MDKNKVDLSLCYVHPRRNFYDLRKQFTEKVDKILLLYRDILLNARKAKKKKLNRIERLLFHKKYSLLIMNKILYIFQSGLNEKLVEPNSPIGKAYKYIIQYFEKLCAFCEIKNAPLENILSERMLKIAIRYRRNSHFFKNQNDAYVVAIITSILANAYTNKINLIKYLTELLHNSKNIMNNSDKWLS